jgi:hypothetical protein
MSDLNIEADDLLSEVVPEIEKAHNGTVLDKWCEVENENGQVWLCYTLKDKIGIVKVPIETE